MTEQTPAPAAPADRQPISLADAKARYSASKATAQAEAKPTDTSEAARILGKRAAEARAQARQAPPPAQAQEGDEESPAQQVVDDSPSGETQDDSANAEQPTEANTEAAGESEEAQTIDLGDGVKVTLDEVRDGFMLKADHTRKTQKLAEERKEFESARTQRLTELDNNLTLLKQVIPQPKSLKQFLEADPVNGMMAFAEQNEAFEKLAGVFRQAESAKAKARVDLEAQRDKELAEAYNPEWSDPTKREKAYSELTAHALQLGASMDDLRNNAVPSWVLKALDGDRKYQAIQAEKGKVTKLVADKPKVTKPGIRVNAQAAGQATVQKGLAKLKSSGSLQDAVALMRSIRGNKPRIQ